MWNRISGKKSEATDEPISQTPRRNDEDISSRRRSGSSKSSDSKKKGSSNTNDSERVFNPTSTSYSSTSRVAYPNTAGASVASSHATASANGNDGSYAAPVLNRNQSLAEKMPKSSSSARPVRDRDDDGDRKSKTSTRSDKDEDDGKREKRSKRDKTERKSSLKNSGASRSVDGLVDGLVDEINKGPADFSQQVGSSGFQQFPGQYDGNVLGGSIAGQNGTSRPQEHEVMSSHVQDQFPGQFPSESAEPYRPPLAANEGGPGLAAEYYGDAGQSVAEQPGFRQHSPSLIIGQEPHLLPASSVAAPPPEPSASGGVGAAASFFSGDSALDEIASSHTQQTSSTHTSAPIRPNTTATSSGLSGLGGAAMGATAAIGAAAGYVMGHHSSAQEHDTVSVVGSATDYMTASSQRPPSQAHGSYYSSSRPPGSTTTRPPKTDGRPSHADDIPIYAAAAAATAAGAAGLAGSSMHSNQHYSNIHASSNQQYATPTTPRHRHRGPFGALVDFVRDPDGVAKFEEYSEYVGICRGCFEPGSSPRDAPRRHRAFNRRRSDERIGRTSRVEKTRRDGSDDERGGRNSPSWLATGLAGYGLGKMGEGLFKQTKNFDDTYSVKSGRHSPKGGQKHQEWKESKSDVQRRRDSEENLEIGIIRNGNSYKSNTHDFGASASVPSRRRRSRSRSKDRKSSLAGAALGVVAGASVVGSASRRRSHSGERVAIKSRHRYREASPSERRQKTRRKKKEKGFFNLGLDSSSSSVDLARPKASKRSKGESDEKKAEAALLGLTAATAALAAADRGSSHRKNGVKELVGCKETIDDPHQRPLPDDAGWEDEEDYVSEVGSVDSGLAFGDDSDRSDDRNNERRKRSELSGKGSIPSRRSSQDNDVTAMAGAVGAGIIEPELAPSVYHEPSSRQERPSPPLKYVDPVPVTDFERLDERMATSKPFASRPPLVSRPSEDTPFHQPQPRAPVASSVYATEAPYSQTYPAIAGPAEYSAPSYDVREVSSSVPDLKMRRRDTSPARIGPDVTPSEMTYGCKPSAKDDSSTASGVRFALPEKDEDGRRDKSRRKKDNRAEDILIEERHERKGELGRVGEPRSKQRSDQPFRRSDSPVDSSSKSWALPAAVCLAGAAVGVAAIAEDRKDSNGETKEERRERRRREKRQDEEDDEARRERRRKEKKDGADGTTTKKKRHQGDGYEESREERKARRRREREERDREDCDREAEATTAPAPAQSSHVSFGDLPQRPDLSSEDRKSSERQESPSKKEAYKHEDYSSFFTPDIDANEDQQVKISGANADADISFDQSPNFVIADPRNLRDLSSTPDFSPADTYDKVDPAALKFPWQVPRLRLLYPTPPSTRGSTPIIEPKDMRDNDIEEPSEIKTSGVSSFSEHAQDIGPSNQDEVPAPDSREVVDRFIDPPSDDDLERLERQKPKKIPLSIDQEDAPSDPVSYSDDKNFAAVLAASAEDAGFDPSIIIDNPSYRRRDSPPGSDGRNIPGSFNEEEDESDPKMNRRKKRSSRRQSPPEGRNDDAVVKDMFDQVERAEPREREAPNANHNNTDPPKSQKVKKSKKGSKRSSASEGVSETQALVETDDNNVSPAVSEEITEDSRSLTKSTMPSKDGDSRKQLRNSKPESEAFEEAASAVAIASAVEAGKSSKSSGKKKGSIWDRVLGKSSSSLPETREAEDLKGGEPAEPLASERKNAKKSKQAPVNTLPDDDNSKREDDTEDVCKQEPEISRDTPSSTASSVVRGLADDSDPKRSQEQISESFLGERPDPPPPPDISATREEPPGASAVTLPREGFSRTAPEMLLGQPTDIFVSDVPQSPRNVSSPTAVPIHFRRPTHVRARSSSQSPLASTQNTDDISQPSRPRPRSTQFENSKEYRPLWLVERNHSRQEVPRDETYPPLPSSRSTSRDPSPPPPNEQEDIEKNERRLFDPLAEGHGLLIDTGSRAIQSEVLDSQQATPTAASFQRTSITQEQPSPSKSRSNSPIRSIDVHDKHGSSTLGNVALATVIGGTAAIVLHRAGEQDESMDQDLHRDEPKVLPDSLDDIATYEQKTKLTDLGDQEENAPSTRKKSKREKKSKKRVPGELAEESSPSIKIVKGAEESAEPDLSLQSDEGGNLTREVPANEAVKVQGITDQDTISYVISPKVPVVTDDISEERLEESESKKSKKKKKGKKSFVGLEEPLGEEPLLREEILNDEPSSRTNVDFANPFKEPPHEHFKGTELSPLATPLPDDDDLDLLEEPSKSKIHDPTGPVVGNALETTGESVRHETNMEANAEDLFDAPTKKKKKASKKGKQNVIGEGLPEDSKTSADSTLDITESTAREGITQEVASETPTVPLTTTRSVEDDFTGFSSKKMRKKGKKGQPSTQDKLDRDPVEDSIARETQEIPTPTEVGLLPGEDVQREGAPKTGFEDQTASPISISPSQVAIPSPVVRGSDEELRNLSSKKKRKKDKKRATEVRFSEPQEEEPNEAEPGQLEPEQPLAEQPANGVQVDRQTLVNDEPSRDVSIEPSLSREDSIDLPPSKKESKKAEKSKKSKKAEQDDLNREDDALPQAITSTAQDVQDILSESRNEPTTTREPVTVDRDLQEDPIIDRDDIPEGLQKHDALTSAIGRNHGDGALGATVTVTGAAAAVESLLGEDSHTQTPLIETELDPSPKSDDPSVVVLAGHNNIDIPQEEKSGNDRQAGADPLYDPKIYEPIVLQKSPSLQHPADAKVDAEAIEELPKKKSKKDKKGKVAEEEAPFAHAEPLAAASAQVYETAPPIDSSMREAAEDDFVSFPTKPSKKDKKSKKKNRLDSRSQGIAEGMLDGMATKEVEDVIESRGIDTEPTTLEANEATAMIPEITESTIKAIPDDSNDMSLKRSKKDKKKKKDISKDVGGDKALDQVEHPPEDGEAPNSQAVQTEAMVPQPDNIEPPVNVEPLTEAGQVEKLQEEALQDEPVSKPKSKKDKKKSKKAKASAWDDEVDRSPNDDGPTATTEAYGDSGVVKSLDSMPTDSPIGSGQMANPEELRRIQEPEDVGAETFTGKKEKKKSKKVKDFSWGAFESKDAGLEPLPASQKLQDMDLTQPPSEAQVPATEAFKEDLERRVEEVEGDRPTQEGDDSGLGQTNPKEAEEDPAPGAKKAKKEKKKGKKSKKALDDTEPAKQETADVVETPGLERAESYFNMKAYAIETPGLERNESLFQDLPSTSIPVITSVQGPQDIPEQLTFADIIEPSAIVEPREERAKNNLPQTASGELLTREMEFVHPDEDMAFAQESQKSKERKTSDFGPESRGSFDHEQSRPVAQETNYEDDILIVERYRAHGASDPTYESVAEASPRNSEKSVQINVDENETVERPLTESFETRSREHISEPDTPLSTGSGEMLDPEEQRKYNEEYRKQLEKELSPLREADDLLDTKEQQSYNVQYHEELERQLSNSERPDEASFPILASDSHEIPRPSDTHDIHEVVEQPIPSPLEATLHHTVLSDIIEEKEPRSRSGSLQYPPAEGDERLERKKSKKGKKSKTSRQPVIWEDSTATAGLVDDAEPAIGDEESPRPINLEEPIEDERTAYTDLPSPSKGSPSISRSPKFDNGAEGYFALKPRGRAEEDVGPSIEPHHQASISPELTQDLPNWSSQLENQPLIAHTVEATVTEQERPRRERSPSRERRPRKSSPSLERTQPTSSIPQDEGSGPAGEYAAAAAIGAGVVGAAALSRTESKKGKKSKQGKKNKKLEELPELDKEELKHEQEEAPRDVSYEPKSNDKMEALPERFDDTPPQSPNRSLSPQRSLKDPQHGEDPKHRDSAIQITDSPVVPTAEPVHRPQHDSGYPATELSPIINEHGSEDVREEPEIIDPYTDSRVRTAGFYQDHDERPRSMTSDPRQSIIGSDDQDMPGDRRRSRRRRRRRGSNVEYDSDDSNDSGYDKQRRRRQALMSDEPREPSPVSSTTKNRSSILFDSPPYDKQNLEEAEHVSRNSPKNSVHDEQHRHKGPNLQNQETVAEQSRISEPYLSAQEHKNPRRSIFGGPMNEEEALSGSASPASGDVRGRRNLKNISEDNLEESPLARKGKREMSDVGSPDSGVKARRTSHDLSPLVTGAAAGAAVLGTDDLVRRLHKSSTDEDNQAREMERSGSHDHDRPRRLSNQSNTSALNRDGEWRRQAVGSPDSIHAIIRTPDQVRSSSGQSLRSSGTPPLRRVDRSVSGDLRGASLKSDAKKRAKMAPELEPAITIPSSSAYDPLTDKGKSRGDMADVYVSVQLS